MHPSKVFLLPMCNFCIYPLVTMLPTLLKKKITLIRLNLLLTSLCFLFSYDFIMWEWMQLQGCRELEIALLLLGCTLIPSPSCSVINQHLPEVFTSGLNNLSELVSKPGCLVYDTSDLSLSPFCLKLDNACPSPIL